jgi:hypothetical protein
MASDITPFIKRYRIWILAVVVLIVAASIWRVYEAWPQLTAPSGLNSNTPAGPTTVIVGGLSVDEEVQDVPILLSEGKQQAQTPQPVPVAYGEPLSESRIQSILGRLPAFELDPEDQVDFRLALDPIPPPRPGETITETFPPAEGPNPTFSSRKRTT